MRHDDAAPRLPELVGLQAAGADQEALRAHVAGCARCAERLAALRRIDAELRAAEPPEPVSARLERRVLAIPLAGGGRDRPAVGARGVIAVAAAAVVALAVALGVVIARDGAPSPRAFEPVRVVTLQSSRPAMTAQAEIGRPEAGRLPARVVATGLSDAPGRYYGLWLTGAAGCVSAGSFRREGTGRCVVLMQLPDGEWTGLAITRANRPPSPEATVARAPL